MVGRDQQPTCPILQKLNATTAGLGVVLNLRECGVLIDQLTDLETEGLRGRASRQTMDAIRTVRLDVRVASLMSKLPVTGA